MKTLHLGSALFLAALPISLHAAPAVSVEQAAAIAQAQLKERGLTDRVFVTSLALEKDGLARGDRYWYARWSANLPLEERKTELGVRINMDGSVVRVVENPQSYPQDHRSRSNRPSILDLKH